jgi:ABC-2 type transport system ATP-binding protein
MNEAIVARDLVKTYSPEVRALDGLNVSVPEGTVFGLLGPNGAGKSTTVRILTALSRPDRGTAHVAGIDVLADPQAARHVIGVVGQKHGVDPQATGRENMVLQGVFYGLRGRELRARVDDALAQFDLADVADRRVKTYSGGMQRRLDVAMGLIHRPRVLFLDEPTTGLDPEVRAEMWREIERLARVEGMTILLTTHYLEEADRLADEIAIVDHGKVVASGTPEALKRGLEGDTIEIEIGEGDEGATRGALARVDGIGVTEVDGRVLRVRAPDGAGVVPAVLAALDAHGIKAASLTMARPSLDEVYLRHAGRRLDAEEVAA